MESGAPHSERHSRQRMMPYQANHASDAASGMVSQSGRSLPRDTRKTADRIWKIWQCNQRADDIAPGIVGARDDEHSRKSA
jgi:hypothetical protein